MTIQKDSWIKNAIIYHILIDRFSGVKTDCDPSKPVFCGGSLNGIKEKISYLQNLGVDTIWISPFYKTDKYHGYHITDFYKVDPHFGTKDELHDLISTVHESNMKIIADFVPNHCSKYHPFFIEALKNTKSEYRKWFYFSKRSNSYLSFLSFPELPKFNLEYLPTRKYIIDSAKYWLSYGFDGFRLDHVIGPSHRFWKIFISSLKKEFPSAIFIGEAWMQGIRCNELKTLKVKNKYRLWIKGDSSEYLLRSYKGIFDGVLDFHGQKIIINYCLKYNKSFNDILNILNIHYKYYKSNFILPLFLDNHDMDRVLFLCKNDTKILKKMVHLQFSVNQPVIIYYGSETGITQEHSIWENSNHGDIAARQPMNWNNIDNDLFLFYQNLCHKKRIETILS